jgi:hypothetical protein
VTLYIPTWAGEAVALIGLTMFFYGFSIFAILDYRKSHYNSDALWVAGIMFIIGTFSAILFASIFGWIVWT